MSWDCVHVTAHNNSFVGSDWDIDWEEPRQSWESSGPLMPGSSRRGCLLPAGHGEGESVEHQWEVAGGHGGCQDCETASIPTPLKILFAGLVSVVLRDISHRVTAWGSDRVLKQLLQN